MDALKSFPTPPFLPSLPPSSPPLSTLSSPVPLLPPYQVLAALKDTTDCTLPDMASVVRAAEAEEQQADERERMRQRRKATRFDLLVDEEEEEGGGPMGGGREEVVEAISVLRVDVGGKGEEGEGKTAPVSLQEAVSDVRCKIAVQLLLVQVSAAKLKAEPIRLNSVICHNPDILEISEWC